MNCSVCSAQVLFGAMSCACRAGMSREIAYVDAMRAWWPVFWPSKAVAFALIGLNALVIWLEQLGGARDAAGLVAFIPGFWQQLLALVVGQAALLYLLTQRLFSGGEVSLWVVRTGERTPVLSMTPAEHRRVFAFLVGPLLVIGLLPLALLAAANTFLGSHFGLGVRPDVTGDLLIAGPIALKMLVGRQFPGFRIEASNSR